MYSRVLMEPECINLQKEQDIVVSKWTHFMLKLLINIYVCIAGGTSVSLFFFMFSLHQSESNQEKHLHYYFPFCFHIANEEHEKSPDITIPGPLFTFIKYTYVNCPHSSF